MEGNAAKSAARTAGAVLVAGVVLAFALWGNRDWAWLAIVAVAGAGMLGWGLTGGGDAATPVAPGVSAPATSVPKPGSSVQGPSNFGSPASAGTSADYARADHSHGLPDLPATPTAPAAAPVALPTAGGDIAGAWTDVRVTSLQGTPVHNVKPTPGQVLIYNGTRWGPGPVPAPQGPRAVGRGAKDFEIAAAGEIDIASGANGVFTASERSSYRGLKAVGASRGERPNQLVIRLQASESGAKALASDRFMVALTPIDDTGLLRDIRLALRGAVKVDADGAMQFSVLAESATLAGESMAKLRFQVVMTRYEA